MLRQGPVSLTMHALVEPLLAILLIVSPFLFGFSDDGAPTAVAIVAGIVWLLVDLSTRWSVALVRSLPVAVHLAFDLGLGIVLIAAPFLFGFSDDGAPTALFLILGIVALVMALGTRWSGETTAGPGTGRGRSRRRAQPQP